MITYSLDANDTLIDIGGTWEDFARENKGESLTRENVLGKSLFTFVNGREVRSIYKSLFSKVRRQGSTLSFAFQCDSPTCRRRMRIHIDPMPDQGLTVRTELIEEIPREEVPLLDPGLPRTEEQIQICCICSDVRSKEGLWVPIEKESDRRKLLESSALPQLSHGYCPRCLEEQLTLLHRSAGDLPQIPSR